MTMSEPKKSRGVTYQHVLVPLDGSELARSAMPTARALAVRFSADLHTISATGNARGSDQLRRHAAGVLGVGADSDRVHVVIGDAAASIVRRASELESCLVCLSTHARGRFSGAVIGSVARSVLQQSGHPIVAVGPFADRPPPFVTRWPESLAVRRIVACVDGSDASEAVLPVAAAWANALGMTLTILTVVEPVLPPFDPVPESTPSHELNRHPDQYAEMLAEKWTGSAPEVTARVIRHPISPAMGVRAYLDTRWAGLLAVTTQARSGWNRFVGGATAASIVRASTAPTLVVPLMP